MNWKCLQVFRSNQVRLTSVKRRFLPKESVVWGSTFFLVMSPVLHLCSLSFCSSILRPSVLLSITFWNTSQVHPQLRVTLPLEEVMSQVYPWSLQPSFDGHGRSSLLQWSRSMVVCSDDHVPCFPMTFVLSLLHMSPLQLPKSSILLNSRGCSGQWHRGCRDCNDGTQDNRRRAGAGVQGADEPRRQPRQPGRDHDRRPGSMCLVN